MDSADVGSTNLHKPVLPGPGPNSGTLHSSILNRQAWSHLKGTWTDCAKLAGARSENARLPGSTDCPSYPGPCWAWNTDLNFETRQRISHLISATQNISTGVFLGTDQFDAEQFERFALQLCRAG